MKTKNYFIISLLLGFITLSSCKKDPGPLTTSEYNLLSEYMSGKYYGYHSEELMGGAVEETLRAKMFIEDDSLIHDTSRKFHNFSYSNVLDNSTTNYVSKGKIKFTKQFNDEDEPEILVNFDYENPSRYSLYTIRSENKTLSMDSLFMEIKEKVEKEKNVLSGLAIAKQELYTMDEISVIRLKAGKITVRKVLPDSIVSVDRPEFLKSFDSEYKVDKAYNFIQKFRNKDGYVLRKKNGVDTREAFNKFWQNYFKNDVVNISKGNKLEFVDTNSLFFYNKRNDIENLEIKINMSQVDLEDNMMFSAGNVAYLQGRPGWDVFPLTEASQSGLKALLGYKQTDTLKAQVFSDGRFYVGIQNPNDERRVIDSWSLHWDKKNQLLRIYNRYASEYLILKDLSNKKVSNSSTKQKTSSSSKKANKAAPSKSPSKPKYEIRVLLKDQVTLDSKVEKKLNNEIQKVISKTKSEFDLVEVGKEKDFYKVVTIRLTLKGNVVTSEDVFVGIISPELSQQFRVF